MAFTPSQKFTGYGSRSVLLGDTKAPALIVRIEAKKDRAELITEIIASVVLNSVAAPANTQAAIAQIAYCLGKLSVIKALATNEDDYADPLEVPGDDAINYALDCRIRVQGEHIFITPANPIEVPESSVYTVVLSAPYAPGDAAGAPSVFIGSLTVRGHSKGGNGNLKSY